MNYSITHSIELVVGISFFIIGLSMILNKTEWIEFISSTEKKGRWEVMVVGIADLLFGGIIIAFHWDWSGFSIFTTLIGLVFFIRGTRRLLFPKHVLGKIPNARVLIALCGAAAVIISVFILYGWYLNIDAVTITMFPS